MIYSNSSFAIHCRTPTVKWAKFYVRSNSVKAKNVSCTVLCMYTQHAFFALPCLCRTVERTHVRFKQCICICARLCVAAKAETQKIKVRAQPGNHTTATKRKNSKSKTTNNEFLLLFPHSHTNINSYRRSSSNQTYTSFFSDRNSETFCVWFLHKICSRVWKNQLEQ